MARKNNKSIVASLDTSIKKSNDISLAKLNQGLALNQMQLLSYAIFSTQKNGSTTFNKADFQRQFNIHEYRTEHAKDDSEKLINLKVSVNDVVNDYFEYWNVFNRMKYEKGTFTFKWNDEFVPHILDLKERYIINDLSVASNFKSSFSWILYEYLKALYGHWHKKFKKDDLMKLFNVENVKSYQTNTSLFKSKVLDVAIDEINQHTELEIHYSQEIKGRAIVAFDLHWSTGKVEHAANTELISEINAMIKRVENEASTFIMIKDQQAKLDAVRVFSLIIDEFRKIDGSTTQEQAQTIYDYIKIRMNELNQILIDTQTKVDASSIFYNWLDERE